MVVTSNIKKCQVMSCGRNVDKTYSALPLPFHIFFTYRAFDHSNQAIPLTGAEIVKDLWVWFDENLSSKTTCMIKLI